MTVHCLHGSLKQWSRLVAVAFVVLLSFSSSTCQQPDAIAPIIAPFEMPQLERPAIPQREFDIRDFGASEGGIVKNTEAIRHTIESAAKAGGGIVVVPAGRWLTGAIHLDDNIDLHLAKGAELLFSQDVVDYLPVVFSRHEDVECYKYSAFIYADGRTNIAITGEGILNGQGKPWWLFKTEKQLNEKLLYDMGTSGVPVDQRVFDGTEGKELRPAFFQPMRCKNVLVEGVTFLYGAFWTITPTYCENVIVRKVHIVTEGDYGHTPNGDGVDPSSSRNVLIEDCVFDTGDDCIAIKAGRDADGLRVNRSCENIVIRNCRGLSGHGGIVIGSETSGGVRNVYATHCRFDGTDRIVRLKTARGRGGVLERMWFKDLSGENILREAIHLNMLYTGTRLPAQPVSVTTPAIRDIHFENIRCFSGKSYAVELLGLPERAIENVSFDDLSMSALKGIACTDARGIQFRGVRLDVQTLPLVTLIDGESIRLDSVTSSQEGSPLLMVAGAKTREIRIRKSGILTFDKSVSVGPEVAQDAVVIEK